MEMDAVAMRLSSARVDERLTHRFKFICKHSAFINSVSIKITTHSL